MNILGVYWGLGSGASLFVKDSITKAVNEERFTRLKNEDRFPLESIKYCMDGLESEHLDAVAVASQDSSYWYHLKRKACWTIEDYIQEQHDYWFPKLLEGKNIDQIDLLQHCVDTSQYPTEYWKKSLSESSASESFPKNDRINIVAQAVGCEKSKVQVVEHHRCHAYYAYYASPFRNKPTLVMTIDGWGDGCNATINIFDEKGECTRVFSSKDANIGRIYRHVTLILGMKPNEHEYKVMGLAPYSSSVISQKAYEVFSSTLYVEGTAFKWNIKPTDSYFWFKEKLEGCRFDGIAAGIQRWVDELLCKWVKNAVEEYGIKNVILSGGVAMNIKANGEVAKLPELESLYVPGAPSDESLAMGAVYALADELNSKKKSDFIETLHSLYLGPDNTKGSEEKAVSEIKNKNWEVKQGFSNKTIAKLLYEGKIVARCAGRMEFGARALCNRSIFADPVNMAVVPKINEAIKNRDFWMPFAPVIMDNWADKYLMNEKKISSPYMTIGFETTEQGWKDLPAACHQADRSARPQILCRDQNREVYGILEEFSKLSNRGALLNTSFNLHGYPIVNTPEEALHVFENSGLDVLVLNHFIIIKK